MSSIFTNSFSQNLSLTDLIKLRKLDYEDFESFANARGYEFVKVDKNGRSNSYSYAFHEINDVPRFEKRSVGKSTHFLTYSIVKEDNSVEISYQISLISEYSKIKQSAKALNFVYVTTDEYQGTIFHLYKRGNTLLTLATFRGIGEYDNPTTAYEITVH